MAWPIKGALRRQMHLAKIGFPAIAAAFFCVLSTATVAEAPSKAPGIGGTGYQPGEGNGIGGTGEPQQRNAPGATGIVGTVTGFGSILVNGFEVDYAGATPTTADLYGGLDPKSIRVGQVVEIEAEGDGKHLTARRIAVRYEVAGPIESIDPRSGTVRVLGQTVAADKSIVGTSRSGTLSDLAVGDRIDVSGLRRADGVIVASRIDMSNVGKPAWLRGQVETAGDNGFIVNGVRIAPSTFDRASAPVAGDAVAIQGSYSAGTFQAAKITRLPKEPFAGRFAHLSIEGFVSDRGGGGRFIGGLHLGEGASAANLRSGDRVIVDGRIGDRGRFIPAVVQPSQFQRGGRSPFQWRQGPAFRNGRSAPHFDMHRNGKPWQNRGSPRRGRYRKW